MKEQPHYNNFLTRDFFEEHYVKKGMSFPMISDYLKGQGHNIAIGTLYKYAKKHGIGRTCSEAKRHRDPDPLDWNQSFITEEIMEAIDGFLLGDGNAARPQSKEEVTRLGCGVEHQEFCNHLMSNFIVYKPSVIKVAHKKMSSGLVWIGQTKMHPDFYLQYKRWYKPYKIVPRDVRLTRKSVMLWYLGDGSVVSKNNTVMIRFSTDGFVESDVEFLAERVSQLGIQCHRNNDNRIYIEAKGIPAFFEFIGKESPVDCYKYKFEIPEWRFEAKRMSDVAEELGVDYQRLAYLVKIGEIQCYRASDMGRPRFLPEHIEACKEMIRKGKL